MAISSAHYRLMVEHRDILPVGGDVLQIGEANWYGDEDPARILELTTDPIANQQAVEAVNSGDLFFVARMFYHLLFQPKRIDSIDVNGTPSALRQDLNRPVRLARKYDMTVNHGTAEHVFHIAQVFGTMHAWTKPGGLMIHESPWMGWPDHGFYTLQPGLFYDLAAANGYEVVSLSVCSLEKPLVRAESREHLSKCLMIGEPTMNTILFVVLRKASKESEFQIPIQGIYNGELSEHGRKAWQELR